MKLFRNRVFVRIGDGKGWRFLELSRYEKPETTTKQGSDFSFVTCFPSISLQKTHRGFGFSPVLLWCPGRGSTGTYSHPVHGGDAKRAPPPPLRQKPRALKTIPRSPADVFSDTSHSSTVFLLICWPSPKVLQLLSPKHIPLDVLPSVFHNKIGVSMSCAHGDCLDGSPSPWM